jgi:hypothetical protein
MAKFYLIQLNSVYLTSDGTSSGKRCKLTVSGVENLVRTRTGFTSLAIDGTPVTQIVEQNGKGFAVEISIETLTKTVFDDLIELINNALVQSATIDLIGTGETGNFNVDVIPLMPNPFSFESFRNNYIKNVALRFVTT